MGVVSTVDLGGSGGTRDPQGAPRAAASHGCWSDSSTRMNDQASARRQLPAATLGPPTQARCPGIFWSVWMPAAAMETFDPSAPLVIGGLSAAGAGHETRYAEIAKRLGVFIGTDLNTANDNLWFTLLLKRPSVRAPGGSDLAGASLDVLTKAMTGGEQLARDERAAGASCGPREPPTPRSAMAEGAGAIDVRAATRGCGGPRRLGLEGAELPRLPGSPLRPFPPAPLHPCHAQRAGHGAEREPEPDRQLAPVLRRVPTGAERAVTQGVAALLVPRQSVGRSTTGR